MLSTHYDYNKLDNNVFKASKVIFKRDLLVQNSLKGVLKVSNTRKESGSTYVRVYS